MNDYECDGTDIFMRCRIECSIQRYSIIDLYIPSIMNLLFTIAY